MPDEFLHDDSGYRTLSGTAGDPVSDGLAFTAGGGDGSCIQDFPSEIDPGAGAASVFEYAPGIEGAIRFDGAHRIVYLAFGLEAISTGAMRDTVMYRSLEWLVDDWPDVEGSSVTFYSVIRGLSIRRIPRTSRQRVSCPPRCRRSPSHPRRAFR